MLETVIALAIGFLVKWIFEKISIVKVSKSLTERLPEIKILITELEKAVEDNTISEEEAQRLAKNIVSIVLNK